MISTARSAATGHDPIIRLAGVHKRFGDQIVLAGIDLNLLSGRTTVIIGESGAGKSVILNHIVRLLRPDKGEVYFSGKRIDNISERELVNIRSRFGFLFQLNALFDSMTVFENVAFPIREHTHLRDGEIAKIVRQKLDMVGLDGTQGDAFFLTA